MYGILVGFRVPQAGPEQISSSRGHQTQYQRIRVIKKVITNSYKLVSHHRTLPTLHGCLPDTSALAEVGEFLSNPRISYGNPI